MFFKDLKLSAKPFSNTTDPVFYYMTDTARKAADCINQGIEQQAPCVVLSGEAGTGKTTLIHYLMSENIHSTHQKAHWSLISQTLENWPELQLAIAQTLRTPGVNSLAKDLNRRITADLKSCVENKMLPVLIIDEAQCLGSKTLNELFSWRDVLKTQGIGVTIILSGQAELNQRLIKAESLHNVADPFRHCRLTRMSFDECRKMIAHRLKKAAYFGPALFSDQTLRTIFSLSGGIPRRVVTICDLAMFTTVAHVGQSVTPIDIHDISAYILRTVGDEPETKRALKTESTILKSNLRKRPENEGFDPSSIKKVPVQQSHRYQGMVTVPRKSKSPFFRKYLTLWQMAFRRRKKDFIGFLNHRPVLPRPRFRPWGWAVAYLLIAAAFGYVWLPSRPHTFTPTSVAPLPTGQALTKNLEIGPDTIIAEFKPDLEVKPGLDVKPGSEVIPGSEAKPGLEIISGSEVIPSSQVTLGLPASTIQNRSRWAKKVVKISGAILEKAEEPIQIDQIFTAPDISASNETAHSEKPAQNEELLATTSKRANPGKNKPLFQTGTLPILKQETMHIENNVPPPDLKKATKPAGNKHVTVKNIKPATPIKTITIKKLNPSTISLVSAIRNGHINLVRQALSDGADPNTIFSKDQSALIAAVEKGFLKIVQLLVDGGATINQPTPSGETALIKAAWKGDVATTEWLLSRNARVNIQNQEGRTALFYAAIRGHNEIVDRLLRRGARWNLADRDGRTPLMAAAWNGHTNIVRRLLSAGADPNRKDRDGWTPLMFAAFEGHTEIGKHILLTGADLSLKNNNNQTGADLAIQRGHTELTAMISNYIQ